MPSSSFLSSRFFIYRAAWVTTSLEWSNRRIYCTPTWNPSLVRNAWLWTLCNDGTTVTVPRLDESDTPSGWSESSPSVPDREIDYKRFKDSFSDSFRSCCRCNRFPCLNCHEHISHYSCGSHSAHHWTWSTPPSQQHLAKCEIQKN